MDKSRVVELLSGKARPIFTLVDLARATDLDKLLPASAAEVTSLYEGKDADELREVAPYLIAIGENSLLLERLVAEGWGRAWALYLTSDRPFAEVRKHLRKFLRVSTEDGEELYFRFYDPRVLRVFLPTCTLEQITEFFGPITSFWVEGEDPAACIVFRLGSLGLETEAIDLRG